MIIWSLLWVFSTIRDGKGVIDRGQFMECFTHIGSQAIGVCKICGKAVCRGCAIDGGMHITCCEACSKEAVDLHELNQRGKKIYGIGVPRKTPSGVIVWLLFAALFGGFGIFQSIKNHQPDWFLLLFGAVSLLVALLAYSRSKDSGLQC